jgi:hypothetical protein
MSSRTQERLRSRPWPDASPRAGRTPPDPPGAMIPGIMMSFRPLAAALLAAAVLLPVSALHAQVTGSFSGTILDATGGAVPNGKVTLTSEATAAARDTQSGSDGDFAFHAVAPGFYTISIEAPGFKKYERKRIELTPSERYSTGAIRLEVGAVTETVVVSEQIAAIQTSPWRIAKSA